MTPRKRAKGARYDSSMPGRLYSYFTSYSETGAPSFGKFARSIGATLEDIVSWRKYREFDRSWRECSEIRRDYLIDTALAKRNDPSLTKFLLSAEYHMGEEDAPTDSLIEVRVDVVE